VNKYDKVKQIIEEIFIFVDEYCANCEVCEDKDCPLDQLLEGKINRFGVRLPNTSKPTFKKYEKESDK